MYLFISIIKIQKFQTNYFKEQISPIASHNKLEEEFVFDIDKYFAKEKLETHKKSSNSILNINITNITNTHGPPTFNSITNNGYNYNQNFFDNSVINKINHENTMITMNLNNNELGNEKINENANNEKLLGIIPGRKLIRNESTPFIYGNQNALENQEKNITESSTNIQTVNKSRKIENKILGKFKFKLEDNEQDFKINNFPLKTEENLSSAFNTDTNEFVKEFQSIRRRGRKSSLKIKTVIGENKNNNNNTNNNSNINISPYIVKPEITNHDSEKLVYNNTNILKKIDSNSNIGNFSNRDKTNAKSESNEKYKKVDVKESSNLESKKIREDNKNKIALEKLPEKNNDLDFENKNVFLKNINPENNRPYSRKRSAFKCLEEIEKDLNCTPKNTNEKINYLHTVNSIINNDDTNNNSNNNQNISNNNNSLHSNNLNNFNKLINNSNNNYQKLTKERKPEIKNAATFNKINMPLFNANNNNHSNNNIYQHDVRTIANNHYNKDSTNYSEYSNRNYGINYQSNNINTNLNNFNSNKKPEFENCRRKLYNTNNNNNINTTSENDFNLNQTAANPTSNNLINFENQIKNAGVLSNTHSQNNILNKIGGSGNTKILNSENNGLLNTPIFTKDYNNNILSLMNNTNTANSNPMNITKFSNANNRIESRRVTSNAANSIINHSYFGSTQKNLGTVSNKEPNKNKNFLII